MQRDKPGEGEEHAAQEENRGAGVGAAGEGDGEWRRPPALCSTTRQVSWGGGCVTSPGWEGGQHGASQELHRGWDARGSRTLTKQLETFVGDLSSEVALCCPASESPCSAGVCFLGEGAQDH